MDKLNAQLANMSLTESGKNCLCVYIKNYQSPNWDKQITFYSF